MGMGQGGEAGKGWDWHGKGFGKGWDWQGKGAGKGKGKGKAAGEGKGFVLPGDNDKEERDIETIDIKQIASKISSELNISDANQSKQLLKAVHNAFGLTEVAPVTDTNDEKKGLPLLQSLQDKKKNILNKVLPGIEQQIFSVSEKLDNLLATKAEVVNGLEKLDSQINAVKQDLAQEEVSGQAHVQEIADSRVRKLEKVVQDLLSAAHTARMTGSMDVLIQVADAHAMPESQTQDMRDDDLQEVERQQDEAEETRLPWIKPGYENAHKRPKLHPRRREGCSGSRSPRRTQSADAESRGRSPPPGTSKH